MGGAADLPEDHLKIVVDYDECASNAVCMGIAPEVFEVRDDGFLYVLNETRAKSCARRSARRPTAARPGAITIVEDE